MKRILLALALLAPALAGAQDLNHPWTLQECLDWALEHNLTLKQSELNVAQREIQLNTSKNAYFPNVSGSANESVNFGRGLTEDNTYTTGATTTNTSFSIGTGMSLFDGMARPNNVKLSQLNLDAALADLERARDDIRVSVAKAYVQVVYDYDIVDVARDQLKLDQAQVDRLQAMVENGKASQAELSQQKATLAQSDYTLVQAENNLRNALLDLSQLLDFPNADGFSIVKPEIAVGDHLLARPEDIYADAVEQRPGVKAEQLRLKGSDLSIKIAKAGFSPTLSLSGGMGTSYAGRLLAAALAQFQPVCGPLAERAHLRPVLRAEQRPDGPAEPGTPADHPGQGETEPVQGNPAGPCERPRGGSQVPLRLRGRRGLRRRLHPGPGQVRERQGHRHGIQRSPHPPRQSPLRQGPGRLRIPLPEPPPGLLPRLRPGAVEREGTG